mgnify:FL=1
MVDCLDDTSQRTSAFVKGGIGAVHQAHRWFETENQKLLWDQRVDKLLPEHLSPFSVLVAAMGNYWQPGCKEAAEAMCEFTWNQGYQVTLWEEPDCCYNSYDGLGTMRNKSYMKAILEGYEYLCYVDNDVKAPKDALVRLMHRMVPIISPIVVYADGLDHGLGLPNMEQNRGLAMVGEVVLSMLVFQAKVFLPWALIPFWDNAIGSDESLHFRRLAMAGHRPFVDTDVVVTAMKPPTFPLKEKIQARSWVDLHGRD